jgi:hypothetical protein
MPKLLAVAASIISILGSVWLMIRWFYVRTLLRLDAARKQIRAEQETRWRQAATGEPPETVVPIPLERVARKANIPLWRARRATQWDEIRRKYRA